MFGAIPLTITALFSAFNLIEKIAFKQIDDILSSFGKFAHIHVNLIPDVHVSESQTIVLLDMHLSDSLKRQPLAR